MFFYTKIQIKVSEKSSSKNELIKKWRKIMDFEFQNC